MWKTESDCLMDAEHIETMKIVKKYVFEKDFEGLKKYIESREKEVLLNQQNNSASDYIDTLINEMIWKF